MSYTLGDIADLLKGDLSGEREVPITGVNALEKASEGDISFYSDPRFKESLKSTKAAAIFVSKRNELFPGPQILVPNPVLAFAKVTGFFAPSPSSREPGISEGAVIHEGAQIGNNAVIYPHVYVGEGAVIGDDVILFPGVFIGDRARVGNRSLIYPNVSVLHDCLIGNDVIIHAGTTIGSDGFGFVRDGSVNVKIPQIGIVQIDDDVEIGANNAIDRAALGKTWLKRGVKTDNLVQIAHNVVIGEDTILVAQVAVGGSARIGREVVIGGQVAIADHLEIGDRAMIGSQSGVAKSLAPGKIVSGTPTMPHKLWLRTRSLITRLPDLNARIKKLEKKIQSLEKRMA